MVSSSAFYLPFMDHPIRRWLRQIRGAYGLDQKGLADMLGVSRSAVGNWEAEKPTPMPADMRGKVAALFPDIPLQSEGGPKLPGVLVPEETGKVKVYGSVSAGDGNTSSVDGAELEVPVQFARQDFGALVVEGDSMMPFLMPSDITIFRDHRQEKVGHIMCAQTAAGEWVVKKLVYESGSFRLRSLNSERNYPDIEPPFTLCGYLVGLVRDEGTERLIRLNPQGLRLDR